MNIDIVSDACNNTFDIRKNMDKDPSDSGYSSGSYEVVNSVKGRESKLIETDLCVICGDKATKYRYSHYGLYSVPHKSFTQPTLILKEQRAVFPAGPSTEER